MQQTRNPQHTLTILTISYSYSLSLSLSVSLSVCVCVCARARAQQERRTSERGNDILLHGAQLSVNVDRGGRRYCMRQPLQTLLQYVLVRVALRLHPCYRQFLRSGVPPFFAFLPLSIRR